MSFFHASEYPHACGTELVPMPGYDLRWGRCGFYRVLEALRPAGKLGHKEAVFLCDSLDALNYAGGFTDYLFEVKPEQAPVRHDMHWSTQITCLIDEFGLTLEKALAHPEIIACAHRYWQGEESNRPLWEYLTTSAVVIAEH